MNNNWFITAGVDKNDNVFWIKNTDPVVWCNEKTDAKRYINISDADFDIRLNEDTFRLIFNSSNMNSIEVYEVNEKWEILDAHVLLDRKGII